jgi:hypothetical protein
MRLPRPFSGSRGATSERATVQGLSPESGRNGRGERAETATIPPRLLASLAPLGREPWIVLVPLLVAQWLALVIFVLSVPRNGWLFYQGGDETFFYTDAWVLSEGHIPESKVGYAWSLVLAPLPALLGPSFLAALPAIVLLQTLVLMPVGLLAVYGIGARIGGRAIGYGAAALWVAAPFLSIPLFVDRYHEKFVEQFLPQALGLTGLGDYPSTVCLLVSGYFLVRALDSGEPNDAWLAGLAAAFAIGIKPSNALFLAGPLPALAVARRWRAGAAFALATIPPLVALVIWKARGLGYLPVLTPDPQALAAGPLVAPQSEPLAVVVSRYAELDWDHLHANYLYLREVFWSTRLVQWLPAAGFLAVARLAWPKAIFLGGWLGAFVLVKGSSPEASLEAGTLLRLMMPALPAFALLAVAIPLLAPRVGPRIAARFPPLRTAPPSRIPVVAAVVLFGLLPIPLLAALPPLQDGRAATLSPFNVFLPVENDLGVRGSVGPDGVTISWRRQRSRPARIFYTVFRSPARFLIEKGSPEDFPLVREGLLCETSGGAHDCTIEMVRMTATRGLSVRDGPPPGKWTYRVGIAANWRDDEEQGDTLLLSKPVTVTVP